MSHYDRSTPIDHCQSFGCCVCITLPNGARQCCKPSCRMLHTPKYLAGEPIRCPAHADGWHRVRLHPETWCACQDAAASSAAGEMSR